MRKYFLNKAIFLTILCVLSVPFAFAGDDTFASMTLRGLTKINVVVDGIHRDFAKYGLSASALKTQIETELNNHGIVVADEQGLLNDPQVARLRIKVNANENQYRFYHYGIRLELAQKIPMNNSGGYIAETTWTSAQTGVIMPMDLSRLNTVADSLVAIFLKEFHAQNPKVAALK